MTDTPETRAAVIASEGQWSFVLRDCCERLERERDEAIRQRDETNKSSKYAVDFAYEEKLKAERERDDAKNELHRLTEKIGNMWEANIAIGNDLKAAKNLAKAFHADQAELLLKIEKLKIERDRALNKLQEALE